MPAPHSFVRGDAYNPRLYALHVTTPTRSAYGTRTQHAVRRSKRQPRCTCCNCRRSRPHSLGCRARLRSAAHAHMEMLVEQSRSGSFLVDVTAEEREMPSTRGVRGGSQSHHEGGWMHEHKTDLAEVEGSRLWALVAVDLETADLLHAEDFCLVTPGGRQARRPPSSRATPRSTRSRRRAS